MVERDVKKGVGWIWITTVQMKWYCHNSLWIYNYTTNENQKLMENISDNVNLGSCM